MNEYISRIISYIANKEDIIRNLLRGFDESEKRFNGLSKAYLSVQENTNEENTRKMLAATINTLKEQMEINKQLISLLVMIVSDDDFTGKQAKFAIKTGQNPQDVLREMIRDKMGMR